MSQGTLEGTGPNKGGVTAAPCRYLGMNSMGDNAAIAPTNRDPDQKPSPLVNAVNTSNDTQVLEVPAGGTIEATLDMWSR